MAGVDAVVRELYGLPPAEFTAARDARAAEARKTGDSAAAKRIAGLRKPTRAAWASNLLVRRRPAETEQLLELGRALREAHQTLDGAQLKELGHQQYAVIAALAREARKLAQEAGQTVSDDVRQEVEQILRAALSDPATAEEWAAGTLSKTPEAPVGFVGIDPDTLPPRRPATTGTPAKASTKAPPHGPKSPESLESPEPTAKAPAKTASREEERRRARLDKARTTAEETRREAETRDETLRAAEVTRQQAHARADEFDERVADLQRLLREAKEEQRGARGEANRTTERLRDAERAAKKARRAADAAAREARRLGGGDA